MLMKSEIERSIAKAVANLVEQNVIPKSAPLPIQIERPKTAEHGDFSANIVFLLAKPAQKSPRDLAEKIIQALPNLPQVSKVEIAGAGFINFYLKKGALNKVINQVLTVKEAYGNSSLGNNQKILIEFVSANPTGPLHVGHGRGAAF